MQLKVKIRFQSETAAEAVELAEVPLRPEALDSVIPMIQSWGLVDGDGNLVDTDLVGQFVKDGADAYFEIVISE